MIIPAIRLLAWVGGLGVPLAFACGPLSGLRLPVLLLGLLAALAAAADAFIARRQLRGLSLELPAVVHLARGRAGDITAVARDARKRALTLHLGLGLPAACTAAEPVITTPLSAGSTGAAVRWTCTAMARGRWRLTTGYAALSSPLGLWLARAALPVSGELRVYPDLAPERKRLASLFLRRNAFGARRQRQRGQGREFESLRDYLPGDSYDTINWKATAKRQRPVTTVHQIERTQEVYVVIDTSRLTGRAPADAAPGETILEHYLVAALVLLQVAQRQGDRFGVIGFAGRVHAFVPARNGDAHYRACRDALHQALPQPENPDFDELVSCLRLRLRRRALLLFLTCLDDRQLAEQFTRTLSLLERQHLVLVSLLRPPHLRPLFTPPDPDTVPQLYARLAGHLLWHDLRELERELRQRGVTLALLEQAQLCPQLVTQYLGIRQRQAL